MKKFITTIPLQLGGGLKSAVYESADNDRLMYDKEISFPILSVVNAYAEKGETVKIFYIRQEDSRTIANKESFLSQLRELEDTVGCICEEEEILIPDDELIVTHLKTFEKLIERFEDRDILYACMTFGTKPVPIVEMLALNYAYRALNDVSIGCVVYGQTRFAKDPDTGELIVAEAKIFDVTSLIYMDEIVRKVADLKPMNPLNYIKTLLATED